MRQLDYPAVGVCAWRDWSQEAACWLLDPRGGRFPATSQRWRDYRQALRMVRAHPYSTNPWRRCFARYNMTPFEAGKTIMRDSYADDIQTATLMNKPAAGYGRSARP